MGPLRADVQGSVHKGKRTSDMVTAIKILPLAIRSHSADFKKFQTAAEHLKKINSVPNANLARVLNYGVTEVGSHLFIETEFIEGPDLEELLQPPHDKVFNLLEVIKVADHLANALAQSHRCDVVHGNIKSTNIRFSLKTADYVLVGFGWSALTDQQRKSLKLAENPYMAPEQVEGKLLLQSDIYSYGVILYELLAGSVPFVLYDKRGVAPQAEVSSPTLPLLIETRRENLPDSWPEEQRQREMLVPEWLLQIIAKCLETEPENRFMNGEELQQALVQHSISSFETQEENSGTAIVLQNEVERLRSLVIQSQENSSIKEAEMARLKAMLNHKEEQLSGFRYQMGNIVPEKSEVTISRPALLSLIVIIICLGALAAYFLFEDHNNSRNSLTAYTDTGENLNGNTVASAPIESHIDSFNADLPNTEITNESVKENIPAPEKSTAQDKREAVERKDPEKPQVSNRPKPKKQEPENREPVYQPPPPRLKYTLGVSEAHFYGRPDEEARLNHVLVPSDNSELVALEDSNGFIYVSFFDTGGKMVRGWLRKQDLRQLN